MAAALYLEQGCRVPTRKDEDDDADEPVP